MRIFYSLILSLLLTWLTVLCPSPFSAPIAKEIRHLELGAANYYRRPGLLRGALRNRYAVLEKVVERLVPEFGPQGVIYLNDIDASGLELAERYLKHHLKSKGLNDIRVQTIVGDYNEITLQDLDSQPVNTLYLNNPNQQQLPGAPEELSAAHQIEWQRLNWTTVRPHDFNQQVVQDLLRLSTLSRSGLRISSYIYKALDRLAKIIPHGTLTELNEDGYEYYDLDGRLYSWEKKPKVYLIKIPTSEASGDISNCQNDFL